jgi:hypothetical protein
MARGQHSPCLLTAWAMAATGSLEAAEMNSLAGTGENHYCPCAETVGLALQQIRAW